jgi:hypothetical protein
MAAAYHRGEALAGLLEEGTLKKETARDTAVVVDLTGPEAVAFAAGLARVFEPVFLFDNWPHPRGVVWAHLTLAAALYYRPLFNRYSQGRRTSAPPAFVLDRNRLAPYRDETSEFDNRYVAKMPSGAQLKALRVKHVLYVTHGGQPVLEADDLNEAFVEYRAEGLDVKLVAAEDFQPDPSEPAPPQEDTPVSADVLPSQPRPTYYFGGSAAAHAAFWSLYAWRPGASAVMPDPGGRPPGTSGGHRYEPQRRATMFSNLPRAASGGWAPRPSNFGRVMMRVAATSRAMLGPAFASRSSWHRSSSGSGG